MAEVSARIVVLAGELFHWDLRTRRCRHRHADAGMSPITCIDYSETVRTTDPLVSQASLLNSFGTAVLDRFGTAVLGRF